MALQRGVMFDPMWGEGDYRPAVLDPASGQYVFADSPQGKALIERDAQGTPEKPKAKAYSQQDFYGLRSNLGMDVAGGKKSFTMPLYAINPRTGQPEQAYVVTELGENGGFDAKQTYYFPSDGELPTGATSAFAGGYSYGNDRRDITEPLVIGGLTAMSAGMLGPALAAATGIPTATAAGVVAGTVGPAIATGEVDPEAVLKNAAIGAAAGQVAGAVNNTLGGGMLGNAAGGAAAGATTTGLTGGDIGEGALSGGISSGTSAGLGGGPVGNAVGQVAAAAATDQDMNQALMRAGLQAGVGSLQPAPSYDLGGGLSVDASGNVTGGMFSSSGTDSIDYSFAAQPVETYEPTPVATYEPTPQGSGLTIGSGNQGLRLPTTDSLLSAPSGDLGITASPDSPLGDPLSFINTGGTTLYTPPSFSLPPIGGEGLRLPTAPNIENMGGGQGLTAISTAPIGDPTSFINSPEVLSAVTSGVINENGMLPTGGAALGDPTSPINAGTFAQPGVETTPGAIAEAAAVQAPAPAVEEPAASGPVRASIMQSPQQASAPAPAPKPAKPATPQRKFDDKKIEQILERLREAGIVPQQSKTTTPGAQRAGVTATSAQVAAADGAPGLPAPAGAPKREEGQSDQQYTEALVTYINSVLAGLGGKSEGKGEGQGEGRTENPLADLGVDLSAQRLADLGLTPGTPEYYEYLMSQLDDILARIFSDLDPDDAKFSSKIRAKTRGEMEALYRVLYVRGVLGQLMGSGRYLDPFTGNEEDVIAPEGQTFNPSVGAYHRGLARSFDELRGMSASDVRRRLGGMLERNPDLFGMQASANARRIRETLAAMGYDPAAGSDPLKRRQRGMFSGLKKG